MPDDAETAGAPGKGRSLAGFYIAIGVVAGLVLLGAWLWTQLRVRYWEHSAQAYRGTVWPRYDGWVWNYTVSDNVAPKAIAAVQKLARCGPRACPAFLRLVRHPERAVRGSALVALGWAKPAWGLVATVEAAKDQDREIALAAIWATEQISLRTFFDDPTTLPSDPAEVRRKLLDWWDREGRAGYEARWGKVPE